MRRPRRGCSSSLRGRTSSGGQTQTGNFMQGRKTSSGGQTQTGNFMQGRKPTPAALKLIQGNPGKRPIRQEPQPERGDLPEPPEFLAEDAKAEWRRVAPELYRL